MQFSLASLRNWLVERLSGQFVRWAPAFGGLAVLWTGVYLGASSVMAVGLVGSTYCLGRGLRKDRRSLTGPTILPSLGSEAPAPATARRHDEDPIDLGILIEEMLTHGRYALLLRPQIVGSLSNNQWERTQHALADGMALVPAGEVVLGEIEPFASDGGFSEQEAECNRLGRVAVEDFLLDRYLVTNRQFSQFVASGGYEQMALWERSILAAVLDFVDQTGAPGPRFWQNGRYPQGEDDHPVVGISWYEAAAFARWIGKRLPSDAEWVKAASWPVPVTTGIWQQRKYPWGNAMERGRANLWGTGPGGTVSVVEFGEGVSAGGVYQLVGNAWEWTTADFGYDDLEGPLLDDPTGSAAMKSIRGGAFDTYFDVQANCQFRSGDHPLVRKHNIGFRCALSTCDVSVRPLAVDASPKTIPPISPDRDPTDEISLQPDEVAV